MVLANMLSKELVRLVSISERSHIPYRTNFLQIELTFSWRNKFSLS